MNNKPKIPYYDNLANCIYTTDGGEQAKISIIDLIEFMKTIPKTPRILTMPIQLIKSYHLSDNSILISADIAKAFEEAISKSKENISSETCVTCGKSDCAGIHYGKWKKE